MSGKHMCVSLEFRSNMKVEDEYVLSRRIHWPGRALRVSGDINTNGAIEDDDPPQAGQLEGPKQPVPGSNEGVF